MSKSSASHSIEFWPMRYKQKSIRVTDFPILLPPTWMQSAGWSHRSRLVSKRDGPRLVDISPNIIYLVKQHKKRSTSVSLDIEKNF